jgi:hypothetical protein
VIPRFELSTKPEEALSVPPLIEIDAAVTDAGTAPRLESPDTTKAPPEMVVPPELVLVPDSVKDPEPDFVNELEPDTTPDTVAETPDATCTVDAAEIASVPEAVPASEKYNAPADEIPVPDSVNGSATVLARAISKVAPLDTVVP